MFHSHSPGKPFSEGIEMEPQWAKTNGDKINNDGKILQVIYTKYICSVLQKCRN